MIDYVAELLKISSPPTGTNGSGVLSRQSGGIEELLAKRNGFFAFESALEVFPVSASAVSFSLTDWNRDELWRAAYGDLRPTGVCFAQDIFGCQFVLDGSVWIFDPETGQQTYLAEDLNGWARELLSKDEVLTGHPIAHEWQRAHGRLAVNSRLVPIVPFVLGGQFAIENLHALEASRGMRLRAELALQIRDLPDGATIQYEVTS